MVATILPEQRRRTAFSAQGGGSTSYCRARGRGPRPRVATSPIGRLALCVPELLVLDERNRTKIDPVAAIGLERSSSPAWHTEVSGRSMSREAPWSHGAKSGRASNDAKSQELTGTKKHLRLRRQRAGPIRDQLHEWLLHQKPRHPPKSPISTASRYALNQWRELGCFLDAARVPLENNASERSRAVSRSAARTTSPSATSRLARASPACTRSSRPAMPAASTRLPICPTSCRAEDHPKRRLDELLPGPGPAPPEISRSESSRGASA